MEVVLNRTCRTLSPYSPKIGTYFRIRVPLLLRPLYLQQSSEADLPEDLLQNSAGHNPRCGNPQKDIAGGTETRCGDSRRHAARIPGNTLRGPPKHPVGSLHPTVYHSGMEGTHRMLSAGDKIYVLLIMHNNFKQRNSNFEAKEVRN